MWPDAVKLAEIAHADGGELFELRIASRGQRAQGWLSQFGWETLQLLRACLLRFHGLPIHCVWIHIEDLPDMAVQILEPMLVHEAVVLRFSIASAAEIESLLHQRLDRGPAMHV